MITKHTIHDDLVDCILDNAMVGIEELAQRVLDGDNDQEGVVEQHVKEVWCKDREIMIKDMWGQLHAYRLRLERF